MISGGVCLVDNWRLEYSIVSLLYIPTKSLMLEAICLNPFNGSNKEATFKLDTTNLSCADEKLTIALTILHSFIDGLDLPKDKVLYKLRVNDGKIFYICSV